MFGVRNVVFTILSRILKHPIPEQLPGQQLIRVKNDLVVLCPVASPVIALWFIPPVFEPQQTRLDLLRNLLRSNKLWHQIKA
jgi:hypothetical protein